MTVDATLAKAHLRVTHSSEDTTIAAYLAAAKAWVENYTGKKLVNDTVTEEVVRFGEYISLTWGPSPSDLVITYLDTDDVVQTITDALIVRGRAYPAESWPAIAENSAITVEYDAGFVTTPGDLDAAVLLLTGEFYATREAGSVSPMVAESVENLCRPYRRVM